MISSINDWDAFERKVCSIIYKINPYQLSRYDGGADRGRDIIAKFKIDETLYNVIIECKFYQSGVGKTVITPALDWAKVHRPALLYFWIVPYLTPDAKDFIELFEKQYEICVLYEEQVNIEQYLAHYNEDDHAIWVTLRDKVLNACRTSNVLSSLFVPQNNFLSVEVAPYLIDREDERKILLNTYKRAFFIQGISACGKTQLMKYVSHIYLHENQKVLWYTFRPESEDIQNKSFFQTLAHYFNANYNDNRLLLYFQEYGYCLFQELENLIMNLLKQYEPVLFLDDVHNCPRDNISMICFLEKIIEYRICRIYFAGWINIFSSKASIKQNLSEVLLDGLNATHLNQIISHYAGCDKLEVAGIIAERFHGLPGYAVLVNEYTSTVDLESDRQFLHNFLRLLSEKEQILLFMLVFSTSDISIEFLCRNDYISEIELLKNKRLILFRESGCSVHDKYKPFFITYPIENTVFSKTISLMLKYAESRVEQYFDIISIYIDRKNLFEAWQIVSHKFKDLLHCQQNTRFLELLQKIEHDNTFGINPSDIIFKKIALLERVGEYQLCLYYITLLDLELFSVEERETLLYLQMRSLYFTSKYDELLKLFEEEVDNILKFVSREIIAQIFSIIGRVYYIRGLLKGALACYLLSYQYAFNLREKTLEVKIIHRIAMIECSYGLVKESRMTFEMLEKLSNYVTPKRRSYIYYRIAKCFMLEGKFEEAKYFNRKSMKIKESYGDKRGMIFSKKLEAKINLAEQNYMDAACTIKQAYSSFEDMISNKERLACMLVQIRLMLESTKDNSDITCLKNLQNCLSIATDEKLLFRIHTIKQLSKEYNNTFYKSACQKYDEVFAELSVDESHILDFCAQEMESFVQKQYCDLTNECKCITGRLLLKSGFITTIIS